MNAPAGGTGKKSITTTSGNIVHYRGGGLEKRRVQLIGGSTYIVSLPKKWVKRVGIAKSDELAMIGQADGSLVIAPEGRSLLSRKGHSLKVSPDVLPSSVARSVISAYLNGLDTIEILSDGGLTPAQALAIKELEKKLVGLEMIEESEKGIVLDSVLKVEDLDVWRGIGRIHAVVSLMQKEAMDALATGDTALAENVSRRDEDVDRLYFLGLRQLRQAASDPAVAGALGLTPIQCLDLQSVIKRLEHMADHAENVARNVRDLIGSRLASNTRDTLARISRMAQEIHEGAGRALSQGDIVLANDVINARGRMKEICSEFRRDLPLTEARDIVKVSAIVESLERIGDYGTDIAEVAINRSVVGLDAVPAAADRTPPAG